MTHSSALPQAFLAAMHACLGERFSTVLAVREHHGRDESLYDPVLPDAVAYATSVEDISAVLALCHAHRVPVIAYGSGSSLEGHLLAVQGGISLDLSLMDQVLAFEPADLSITVQPGITRKALNDYLRASGLFFPIDPGADASIGGMCATRASGTNAVRYGTMRENVLGLNAVLADGRVLRSGSKAKKSSAGYDLARLFIGSEGTLGVISEITLKLHPQPEAISAAVCSFDSVEGAVQTVIETIQMGIPVARAELVDRLAIQALNQYAKLGLREAPTLFLEFHGNAASVAEQAQAVQELADGNQGSGFQWATAQEERNRLWSARHNALFAFLQLKPGCRALSTDVCVPLSKLAECVVGSEQDLSQSSIPAPIFGHVGDGNFHVCLLLDPSKPEELEEAERLNHAIVHRALAAGGTCTGEHGVGLHKIDFMVQEHGQVAIDTMVAIKQALDPLNLMNPGKIFRIPA
ncbi:2-hydroxy-acid oxidase [Pseudomonas chlororaphis]|jgi:D-lactate dehydrogenase (cytochrome)|uniref:D-lactate dehydrogenase (cytochrome) n=1 Tax=Pseudomonas morbosilactucae TaxID=2938197 RepID=A0ABT0JH59_9PSED|nr:FAD-linked oxidase C-terminal domain-containing protein [Pseudomonas morbosilactucae]MCK9815220.1 FAD-binding protein [Pseudomonas morbosilactucae]ROL69846.1 2-hydroxy-acid oxidase [Pseudomonas chlororaphis]